MAVAHCEVLNSFYFVLAFLPYTLMQHVSPITPALYWGLITLSAEHHGVVLMFINTLAITR